MKFLVSRYFLCITSVYVTSASTTCCAWWICTRPRSFVSCSTDYRVLVVAGGTQEGGHLTTGIRVGGQVALKIVTLRSSCAWSSIRIESLIAKGWTIYSRSLCLATYSCLACWCVWSVSRYLWCVSLFFNSLFAIYFFFPVLRKIIKIIGRNRVWLIYTTETKKNTFHSLFL